MKKEEQALTQLDSDINYCAKQCFRDMADRDYIAARLCYKAQLMPQFFWQGLQATEKYIKCALLLNRISSKRLGHDIRKGIDNLFQTVVLQSISEESYSFANLLYEFGVQRYLEGGYNSFSEQIICLDRLIAEIRRCCQETRPSNYEEARYVRLDNGILDSIIDDPENLAHQPLLWNNRFFGNERIDKIALDRFVIAERSYLISRPDLIGELNKYIKIPKHWIDEYERRAKSAE
ncbi:MAG: hypothetical protein ACFB4J_06710 [Elainellaceae cyanobacterium]